MNLTIDLDNSALRDLWSGAAMRLSLALAIRGRIKGAEGVATLAKAAGVSADTVQRLYDGDWRLDDIRIVHLAKVAAALDVALDIRFAPWSEMARQQYTDKRIPPYTEEAPE